MLLDVTHLSTSSSVGLICCGPELGALQDRMMLLPTKIEQGPYPDMIRRCRET